MSCRGHPSVGRGDIGRKREALPALVERKKAALPVLVEGGESGHTNVIVGHPLAAARAWKGIAR